MSGNPQQAEVTLIHSHLVLTADSVTGTYRMAVRLAVEDTVTEIMTELVAVVEIA